MYSIIDAPPLALPGDDWDSATVSSLGIESLDQAADAASTALHHSIKMTLGRERREDLNHGTGTIR